MVLSPPRSWAFSDAICLSLAVSVIRSAATMLLDPLDPVSSGAGASRVWARMRARGDCRFTSMRWCFDIDTSALGGTPSEGLKGAVRHCSS